MNGQQQLAAEPVRQRRAAGPRRTGSRRRPWRSGRCTASRWPSPSRRCGCRPRTRPGGAGSDPPRRSDDAAGAVGAAHRCRRSPAAGPSSAGRRGPSGCARPARSSWAGPDASISRAFSIALAAQHEDPARGRSRSCGGRVRVGVGLVPRCRSPGRSSGSMTTLRGDGLGEQVDVAALPAPWTGSCRRCTWPGPGRSGRSCCCPGSGRPPRPGWCSPRPIGVKPLPPSYAGLGMPLRPCGNGPHPELDLLAVQLDEGAVDALGHHLVEVGQRQLVHREDVAGLEVQCRGRSGPPRPPRPRSRARPARSTASGRRSRAASPGPRRSGCGSRSPREASAGSCASQCIVVPPSTRV